jgi:hypothetical protein
MQAKPLCIQVSHRICNHASQTSQTRLQFPWGFFGLLQVGRRPISWPHNNLKGNPNALSRTHSFITD